jgi:hypothetical protein
MHNFIQQFMSSELVAELKARHDFPIHHTVTIHAPRADPRWPEVVSEMTAFCASRCQERWNMRAPIRAEDVHFDFERDADAVNFKLRFG